MSESLRKIAENWPAAHFVEEELEERTIPVDAFLLVVGITKTRWEQLMAGEVGMLISECERVAGALGVSVQFIANLNRSYMQWKKQKS